VLIGAWLSRWGALWCVGLGSVLSTVQFFLISDFGVWVAENSMYPPTLTGLLDCYIAGLPYIRNTLAGDVCFAALLFGAHALLATRQPTREVTQLKAVPVPLASSRER
jgi:hypothetical protein